MEYFDGELITKIAQILVALSSLIVSIVALRLSRKVTLKKNLKEKQFELMCQFIESISSEMLLIKYKETNGDSAASLIALPRLRLKNFKQTHSHLFVSQKFIYYRNSVGMDYDFLKFRWNTLMPKTIAEELKKFNQGSGKKISEVQLQNLSDYLLIDFCPEEYKIYEFPKGNEFQSFESFHKFINTVFDKVDEWLREHGAEDLKFLR